MSCTCVQEMFNLSVCRDIAFPLQVSSVTPGDYRNSISTKPRSNALQTLAHSSADATVYTDIWQRSGETTR